MLQIKEPGGFHLGNFLFSIFKKSLVIFVLKNAEKFFKRRVPTEEASRSRLPKVIVAKLLESESGPETRIKMDKPAQFYYLIYLIALFATFHSVRGLGKIVFAVNAGGDSHVDIYGVKYQKG